MLRGVAEGEPCEWARRKLLDPDALLLFWIISTASAWPSGATANAPMIALRLPGGIHPALRPVPPHPYRAPDVASAPPVV